MVSTIPLTELNKLCGLFSSLKLRHSTVILVGVGLHKPQNDLAKRLSWSYFPRQAISFYRCTVVSNFSDNLTPDSNRYWSVLCEIGCRPEAKREPREVIIKKVIRGRSAFSDRYASTVKFRSNRREDRGQQGSSLFYLFLHNSLRVCFFKTTPYLFAAFWVSNTYPRKRSRTH